MACPFPFLFSHSLRIVATVLFGGSENQLRWRPTVRIFISLKILWPLALYFPPFFKALFVEVCAFFAPPPFFLKIS
jgi:hypothetical protein